MSSTSLKVIIVTLALAAAVTAKPHVPFAAPDFLPPVLPPPPSFHPSPFFSPSVHPAPLFPHFAAVQFIAPAAPILPAPAPVAPAPILPAPVIPVPAPIPCPIPLPITNRVIPPVFDPLPFTPIPSYRAIPGPITKTHHISYGLAYPSHAHRFAGSQSSHLHATPLAFPPPPPHHHHHHQLHHHEHLFA